MRNRTHLPLRLLGGFLLLSLGWLLAQTNPLAVAQAGGKGPTTGLDIEKNIVAYVNNVPITRQELAEELIARKGKKQLELLINRRIIEQAAQAASITVAEAEVDADLKDFVRASGCGTIAEFEKRVLKDKQTTLFEYKEDVIKPAIMMRKLGGKRVEITEDELKKAFASKYGEKVQCYVIVERDFRTATNTYTEILKAAAIGEKNAVRNAFLEKARTQADPRLAATAGLIHVSQYGSYANMVELAFQLPDNQMGQVIETPEGHVLLLRDKLMPADKAKKFETEKDALRKEFAENKLRVEVPKLFKELKDKAVVRDFLNNKYGLMDIMLEDVSSLTPKR